MNGIPARTPIIKGLSEALLKWMVDSTPRGIDIDIMAEVLHDISISDHEKRHYPDPVAKYGPHRISAPPPPPQEAHLLFDWRFVVHVEDREPIPFNDFSDLAYLRIGAAAGYS